MATEVTEMSDNNNLLTQMADPYQSMALEMGVDDNTLRLMLQNAVQQQYMQYDAEKAQTPDESEDN